MAALAIEDKKRQYADAEKYLEDVLQSALASSEWYSTIVFFFCFFVNLLAFKILFFNLAKDVYGEVCYVSWLCLDWMGSGAVVF